MRRRGLVSLSVAVVLAPLAGVSAGPAMAGTAPSPSAVSARTTIKVGSGPYTVAVNATTGTAFVANEWAESVLRRR